MSEFEATEVNRRDFLQAGTAATASAIALGTASAPRPTTAQEPDAAKLGDLPRRKLGKTGVDVTILNLGTWRSPGLDRLLRFAYSNGVRYVDTARSYGSEPAIGRWFQAMPEVRKEIFLVTKDSPRVPAEMPAMLDKRLADLKTDHVDLFFVHALGDHHSLDEAIEFASGKAMREMVEKIKKSGKAKFVGFSTHHKDRAKIIQAAADANLVDVIMLQYTPWLDKDSDLNKALDAAHKNGIGLISMKQVAGQSDRILDEVPKRVPVLKERGLTPYQGLLHAIWTDERISSACVSMRNTDQIRENAHAARTFEPLKTSDIRQLRDACLAAGPTFCADCDGRCSHAAGTRAALGDLTRLITYHDQYGYRGEARKLFAAMSPEQKDWAGADLDAARRACPNGLDFAHLLEKVDRDLA
ncbi:MAG: aldo/keto reductase [Isosphaeraceae bacterium]